jgi:hypothetical protein
METNIRKTTLVILLSIVWLFSGAQTEYIKVHFKHGSVRRKEFKNTEYIELGGRLGGHVLVEIGDEVYDFAFTNYRFHLFPMKKHCIGQFSVMSIEQFQNHYQDQRVTSFIIPAADSNIEKLRTLYQNNINKCPYDYAVFGMRCTASAWEMIGSAHILPSIPHRKAVYGAFYPRQWRKKLYRMARAQHWKIEYQEGTTRRKWEGGKPNGE